MIVVLDASALLADLKVNRVGDIKCKLGRSRAEVDGMVDEFTG